MSEGYTKISPQYLQNQSYNYQGILANRSPRPKSEREDVFFFKFSSSMGNGIHNEQLQIS
jgi:hypothetical protein